MSNYLAPDHVNATILSESFDEGYTDASADHRAAVADGTDNNGLEIGYSVGYKAARDYHKEATASGTDATGASRAYLDGYNAASTFHSSNTVSNTPELDAVQVERGFAEGYKAARDYHTDDIDDITNDTPDASGAQRGWTEGYKSARDFHTTAEFANSPDDDRSGVDRGYNVGYNSGKVVGNAAGYNDARDFHTTVATLSNPTNDPTGADRGYNVGYNSGKGVGNTAGYNTASNFHTTNSVTGNDANGTLRGYAEGYQDSRDFHTAIATIGNPTNDSTGRDRGYNVGYNSGHIIGATSETRPHIICGLASNYVMTDAGWDLHTLPCSTTHSSKDATNSNGTITINSAGTWEFYFLFSWAFGLDRHWGQNTVFTRAFIYEGNTTVRGRGVTRRRSNQDWFGSTSAYWKGTVSAGDKFTARVMYDYDESDQMTVFKEATDIDALTPPTEVPIDYNAGSDHLRTGNYHEIFGPACRFVAIKL